MASRKRAREDRPPSERENNTCDLCGQKHRPPEGPHPQPAERVEQPVVCFWSGAAIKSGLRQLSNFHRTPIEIDGMRFPSSEHAWVYQTVERSPDLLSGGALSTFDGLTLLGYAPELIAKTERYWGTERIGAVAKFYSKHVRKSRPDAAQLTMDAKLEIWMRILRAKFVDPHLRRFLISTGESYLLEFCKGAVKRQLAPDAEPERWGGWHYEGRVWGCNHMGRLLMRVRTELDDSIVIEGSDAFKLSPSSGPSSKGSKADAAEGADEQEEAAEGTTRKAKAAPRKPAKKRSKKDESEEEDESEESESEEDDSEPKKKKKAATKRAAKKPKKGEADGPSESEEEDRPKRARKAGEQPPTAAAAFATAEARPQRRKQP